MKCLVVKAFFLTVLAQVSSTGKVIDKIRKHSEDSVGPEAKFSRFDSGDSRNVTFGDLFGNKALQNRMLDFATHNQVKKLRTLSKPINADMRRHSSNIVERQYNFDTNGECHNYVTSLNKSAGAGILCVQSLLLNGKIDQAKRLVREFDINLNRLSLIDAISNQQYKYAYGLIWAGVNIHQFDAHGRDALLLAIEAKRPNLLTGLLVRGAKVTRKYADGETAATKMTRIGMHKLKAFQARHLFHQAAANGNLKQLQLLYKKNGIQDVDSDCADFIVGQWDSSVQKATPLLTFLRVNQWRSVAVVKWLVTHGANVNAVDPIGHTPLMFAAKEGRREIIEYLVAAGANVNAMHHFQNGHYGHYTALTIAATYGHFDAFQQLVAAGADTTRLRMYNTRPKTTNGCDESLPMVKLLHEQYRAFNLVFGLLDAAKAGRLSTVKYILSVAPPEQKIWLSQYPGNSKLAWQFAAESGHQAIAELLLQYDYPT